MAKAKKSTKSVYFLSRNAADENNLTEKEGIFNILNSRHVDELGYYISI